MSLIQIRSATPEDCELIVCFIRELAEYEKLLDICEANTESIHRDLFVDRCIECFLAELDGETVGFALCYPNYSTFQAKPGYYLEDLYVRPEARGKGAGKALLNHLGQLCLQRDYGRLEWCVLNWNKPSIDFYKSLGAELLTEWTTCRVSGKALQKLGSA